MLPLQIETDFASAPLLANPMDYQSPKSISQLFKAKKQKAPSPKDFGTSLPSQLQSLFTEAPKAKSELTSLFNKQTVRDWNTMAGSDRDSSSLVMQDTEFIKKKLKMDHLERSPSTQDGGSSPQPIGTDNKGHNSRTYGAVITKSKYPVRNTGNLNKHLKERRILQVEGQKEDKPGKLVFKVECDLDQNSKNVVSMQREEVLKEDPMLLVYFYESHLQFAKAKDFSPETLKKL